MIFGKIVCFFKGHKRGRLLQSSRVPLGEGMVGIRDYRLFARPRCGHETRYKVKPT